MALRFEHEFMVPVPVERAWPVLLDPERIAPCLPGAALESIDGDAFTGRLRVKVGPITIVYRGSAEFEHIDPDARTLTLRAAGRETRGPGTANAEVTARLSAEDGHTRVRVETSFNVTGRPAQFGRGMLADVGGKLIDRFAANLAGLFEEERPEAEPEPPAPAAAPAPAAPAPAAPAPAAAEPRDANSPLSHRTAEEQELDLLELAGGPLARRIAVPVAVLAALAALAALIHLLRRFRHRA
ncbi:SRPBCC family protein [Sphaerimonospora sp. CA-214678]|uniref:SRPBCC family protein n=1 Tax=Sphaerimonospora sp. CA-214678 TaxID=3240029 RepID=UPI003D9305F3